VWRLGEVNKKRGGEKRRVKGGIFGRGEDRKVEKKREGEKRRVEGKVWKTEEKKGS
jgi:hypothetical protein